jgi:hypothetical protein
MQSADSEPREPLHAIVYFVGAFSLDGADLWNAPAPLPQPRRR